MVDLKRETKTSIDYGEIKALEYYMEKYKVREQFKPLKITDWRNRTQTGLCTSCMSLSNIGVSRGTCENCGVGFNSAIDVNTYAYSVRFLTEVVFIVDVLDDNAFNIVRLDREFVASEIPKPGNSPLESYRENIAITGYVTVRAGEVAGYKKSRGKIRKVSTLKDIGTFKNVAYTRCIELNLKEIAKCVKFSERTGFKEVFLGIEAELCSVNAVLRFLELRLSQEANAVELLAKSHPLLYKYAFSGAIRNMDFSSRRVDKARILLRKGKRLKDVLRLPGHVVKMISERNAQYITENVLLCLESMFEEFPDLDIELVRLLTNSSIRGKIEPQFERVRALLRVRDGEKRVFTSRNIYNYLYYADLNQAVSPEDALPLWDDYVSMAIQSGFEYKKYPRSLKKEHDLMARSYRYVKEEILERDFAERTVKLKELESEGDGYVLRVPQTTQEVVKEGDHLRHCVASYIGRIANGGTSIFFLRKKEFPDIPFVTVEVSKNTVVQIKGACNSEPDSSVVAFLKGWAKEKGLVTAFR